VFQLYLIADRDSFDDDDAWLAAIAAVAPFAATVPRVGLQVRIRGRAPADEAKLVEAALRRIGPARDRALLNATAAPATGYAGVHWPEAALMRERRRGRALAIGASVHSIGALRQAETAGATFAVFGPVFDPSTKPVRGVGVDALHEVASAARIPVLALGGVTPERVAACLEAGASGVAVVSGVFRAKKPMSAARSYMARLEEQRSASVAG
jgi:thiamine-phosphate diphosphorylase